MLPKHGTLLLVALFASLGLTGSARAGAFTPGNLVVLVNADTGAGGKAAPISLREFTTSGSSVQTISISSSGTTGNRLTQSANAGNEGHLSRSADGRYLTFVGYDANAGTLDVALTTATVVLRVVGKIDSAGTVSLGTNMTGYSQSNILSATSVDASSYWTSGKEKGSDKGIRTVADGSKGETATQVADVASVAVHVFNNQLYGSTNTSVFKTDTALPTGASTITDLSGVTGLTTASGFFFLDRDKNGTLDTLYVADQSSGLLKFTSTDGASWTARGSISGGINSVVGLDNGSSVDLFVTTGNGTVAENLLQKLTDTSNQTSNITGSYSTLAKADAGTGFRSVQFSPTAAAVPEPASIVLVGMAAAAGWFRLRSSQKRKRSVGSTGC